MENYDTLSEALAALRKQGYVEDFNLKDDCLDCQNGKISIFHDEFQIDKTFRFEGNSDPADEAVVYAISSDKYHVKGVMVNAYGVYSDGIADEMMAKLRFE